jgi:hypothetical protein
LAVVYERFVKLGRQSSQHGTALWLVVVLLRNVVTEGGVGALLSGLEGRDAGDYDRFWAAH